MNDRPKSTIYERCVAAWAIEEFDFVDITVTANAKVRGHISGRSRQVDVLLENRTTGNPEGRIIVEAKLHGRPIDIEVVEAVEAKLRDVNAAHAVIVSSGGFTKPAISHGDELYGLQSKAYWQRHIAGANVTNDRCTGAAGRAGSAIYVVRRAPVNGGVRLPFGAL